ncbi:bifunctional metallophosphatase/5'-nucleotidase [Parabacteroides sp. AD58]|uniref:Bifunctional metallophosphatase/5'-nucleotidase n=1 Tax=Parabacteroides absconsus TaxID=2951805 RepID=A0ABZ2IQY6_9BACT|nr:bifunctional metallophosphatase/5'-nucleotidase [Parabacteroides sp. AD58]MCM6902962.1 bifunctional metallophosphatase/5'-nucleotidase [Parabacteroides sp. AD58]
MRRISCIFLLLWAFLSLSAATREVKLKLIETSDIHGNFFPYNFITQQDWKGSFARVHSYAQQERQTYGHNLLLMDNGDILQGQPSAYYYNFMDTVSTHITATMMNYMGFVVGNMGNHDVEAGHAVYDRWISQCQFPVLGANIIQVSDEQPYLKPYEIIEREGVKIAVLGMITPAIPTWLPETLWKGLYFADMEQTARKWMPIIQEKEKPDIIIGLFHAGKEARTVAGKYREDASAEIAERIPGFDIIMMGHDHRRFCGKIANAQGDSVLLINPANNGRTVGDVEITLTLDGDKVIRKSIQGKLADMDKLEPSPDFMKQFAPQYQAVEAFVSEKVGTFTETISTRPAYFGPSAFIDFIHSLQLDLTGADISFAAPLSFDAVIKEGDIHISDMFNLYKYENMLYTMELTGKEIKGFLEESYAIWTNQMKSADDHVLLLTERKDGNGYTFTNPSFNFDSAAGIIYTVDVTKPAGQKVCIQSLANGEPFDLNRTYRVALNSYRGNGGGELLTKGAGIPQDQLKDRIISATEKDLRYYMIQYIREKKTLSPQPLNQWKMIPEDWTEKAAERDARLLFD